jgi:hypothetical protein
LLGSTTLAHLRPALGAGASFLMAQAQTQPAAPSGRLANILVIIVTT